MIPVHSYFPSLRYFTYHSNHILKVPLIRLYMHYLFIDIFSPCPLLRERNIYLLTSSVVPCPALLCHCDNLSFKSSSNGPGECSSVAECFCNMCTHIPDPSPSPEQEENRHCPVVTVVSTSWHPGMLLLILAIFNYTFTTVFFLIFIH